ncbi:MAG TPA: hypothetical protein VKR55_06055 [Bradyrhizobium sp.]|uniref:hypothetical protein n=1 Tax=Bradyrhizobium sp. TaxID=376 RepID=UPI002BB92B5F|nr:hypothetical protein [Bradyrhizobium sp.]HLZ01703.1 hypothetical protein [Bradyrhizobium sp.]
MTDAIGGPAPAAAEESNVSAVSWGAIIAGGLAAAAATLVLLAFGAGLGFSSVSPWQSSGMSATTFRIGTGLYLVVIAMLASSIGGYLAGRLRSRWVGAHTHEVYFRDTAHGFLAWAFATVLSAGVLTSAATHLVSGATTGLAQGAGQSVGLLDPYVDTLLRANAGTTRNAADIADSRSEIGRLFVATFRKGGDFNPADRTYLAQLVATRTGLSQADAEKRVSEVITQAKTAADNARKAAAKLSLWLTASLVIGAFCASLAATEGGGLRDGTWKYRVSD